MGDLITQKELSEQLKLSRSTVYRLRKNEDMPYYEVGGKLLFDLDEIKQWIKKTQKSK